MKSRRLHKNLQRLVTGLVVLLLVIVAGFAAR